jgi:hypothetical protein
LRAWPRARLDLFVALTSHFQTMHDFRVPVKAQLSPHVLRDKHSGKQAVLALYTS